MRANNADLRRHLARPTKALVAFVIATLCFSPNAARAQGVDVVVDSTDITLESTEEGKQTAKVTLLNLSSSPVNLQADMPGDAGCSISPMPSSVQPGRRAEVTLALSGCETEGGANITLAFGPQITPSAYVLEAIPAPATEKPRWPLVLWSFVASLVVAVIVAALSWWRGRHYDGEPAPGRTLPNLRPPPAPTVDTGKDGRLLKGQYVYAVSSVTDKGESKLSDPSSSVQLEDDMKVIVTIQREQDQPTGCRIYRNRGGGEYGCVGEIAADDDTTTFTDNWRIGLDTTLGGLGTDWNFKDNWVSSVTVGSGAVIALLAASDVYEAVIGSKPEGAFALFAVTAGLAAALVAVSPLLVKVIGKDLSLATVGGTLTAASVTLVAALGQITTVTVQAIDVVSGLAVKVGAGVIGASIAAVVLWYARDSLWHFIKKGARVSPKKETESQLAAKTVAESIKLLMAKFAVCCATIVEAKKPEEPEAQVTPEEPEVQVAPEVPEALDKAIAQVDQQERVVNVLLQRLEDLPGQEAERNSLL